MKAIQIKKHQVAAIEAIKNAVNNKQPEILEKYLKFQKLKEY